MDDTPRSPSLQSVSSNDTVSNAFPLAPGTPSTAASPGIDVPRASPPTHEADHAFGTQTHRFYLKDGNLKFKLDDGTVYNVHRHFFETHSPRFAAEHLRDELTGFITLPDVASADFQRLLSIIYPSNLGKCDVQTVEEWASVLRLASKWSIHSLCEVALAEIEPRATPVDKVAIAREFGLAPLEYEDAMRLGMRTVIEIARINREELHANESFDLIAYLCINGLDDI
ncbi:hypothetical protein HDZ31DRAFT_69637 [Schizophyllum fasciatum]